VAAWYLRCSSSSSASRAALAACWSCSSCRSASSACSRCRSFSSSYASRRHTAAAAAATCQVPYILSTAYICGVLQGHPGGGGGQYWGGKGVLDSDTSHGLSCGLTASKFGLLHGRLLGCCPHLPPVSSVPLLHLPQLPSCGQQRQAQLVGAVSQGATCAGVLTHNNQHQKQQVSVIQGSNVAAAHTYSGWWWAEHPA
jgi:hypothetical protein